MLHFAGFQSQNEVGFFEKPEVSCFVAMMAPTEHFSGLGFVLEWVSLKMGSTQTDGFVFPLTNVGHASKHTYTPGPSTPMGNLQAGIEQGKRGEAWSHGQAERMTGKR